MKLELNLISIICAVVLLLVGCGNKPCHKDTDCKAPEICVNSTCINIYHLDATIEIYPEPVGEDINSDEQEVDYPESIEPPSETEEIPETCTPVISNHRLIFSIVGEEGTNSGQEEEPSLVTTLTGDFFIAGRIIESTSTEQVLKIAKVNKDGLRADGPFDLLRTRGIPNYHPLLLTSSGMAIFMKDIAIPSVASGKILYFKLNSNGTLTGSPVALDFTTENSYQPSGVDNGSSLFLVWVEEQNPSSCLIRGATIDYDGNLLPAGTVELSQEFACELDGLPPSPIVKYDGENTYLLVYMNKSIPGIPDRDGEEEPDHLIMITIDSSTLTKKEEEQVELYSPQNNKLVGKPALVWAGDRWAVLWEEGGDSTGEAPSYLHLTTKIGDNPHVDVIINDHFEGIIPAPAFNHQQSGQLDMVWNGESLGIIFQHTGPTSGRKLYFAEITFDGRLAQEGQPLLITERAANSFNPAITFMQDENQKYYLFAWLQFSSDKYMILVATYGCTI